MYPISVPLAVKVRVRVRVRVKVRVRASETPWEHKGTTGTETLG